MNEQTGLGIHKAICAIKLALAGGGGITKDRKAPMGYSFRGIEDFDNILCGLTAEHHIAGPYPRVLSKEMIHGTTEKGRYQSHAIIEIEWTYVCELDNSRHVCSTVGEAMDTQDKAYNTPMQAARKYADIMVFRIPVAGDDSEIYVPNPSTMQQPALVQQQQEAPPPMTNGTMVPTQPEPPKRTRGPNKPKPDPAAPPPPSPGEGTHVNTPDVPPKCPPAQQQVVTPQPVPPNYPLTPARTVDMQPQPPPFVPEPPPADANGNVYAPEDLTTTLMGRIGEVNTFPLLYAIAQEADAHVEPGRTELFTAIKHRGVYLFGEARNLSEVQEGFSLVSALGQPLELKKAANEAYAKYRR